jgi:deoxycytidylate deaminase/dephospho-CoA kinase
MEFEEVLLMISRNKVEENLEEEKKDFSNGSSGANTYLYHGLIVIGFTGPLGSGCTYISRALAGKLNYKYYKPSDIIREHVDADEKNNVKVLQDKGNELREEKGLSFLIEEVFRKFKVDYNKNGGKYEGLIIDGIKNAEEVRTLRLAPNFFLFSVHADKEKRCKRLITDDRFANEKKFEEADNRDQFEENKYGQQVKKCDYLSDIIILNNENIPKENLKRKSEFIDNIFWRYIEPIKNYAMERKTVPTRPTIDEFCMTMAYTASKMSSCLKRQVGAIIVQESKAQNENNTNMEEKHLVMPCIISSGYNEVPLGSSKCLYHEDYQMCYRDYLQQNFAQAIKYCPTCGREIKLKIKCYECDMEFFEYRKYCECGNELNVKYKCVCGKEIFKVFIPGASQSPGKMLDMCRALHAEEAALLNLVKINVASGDFVLYTTTQPCNLCANKIANSEIKTVVYSEPYTTKESEEIFIKGGVKTKRFEGIKSSAFFKLY